MACTKWRLLCIHNHHPQLLPSHNLSKNHIPTPHIESRVPSPISSPSSKLESIRNVWYKILGHTSKKVLSQILNSYNLKMSLNNENDFCDACQMGKSHKLPFNSSKTHTSKPLELVYTDLWGPASIMSSSGYRFYISFVDNFSRFT